jgi:hypothetical protein
MASTTNTRSSAGPVWTSPSGTETVTVSGSENSGPQQEARTGPGGSPVQLDGRGVLLGRSE